MRLGMERDADVVVVGAGIVGCATAYFLARRGARVVVVERGPVPGEQSRKNWGFVRQQGRDPLEMPLVVEANRLWQGLERELNADIEWVQGGNLALAADESRMARFETWLPLAREFGLETRLLRARDLDAVVPGLAGGWVGGMHTPGDGHADPEKTTDAPASSPSAARSARRRWSARPAPGPRGWRARSASPCRSAGCAAPSRARRRRRR